MEKLADLEQHPPTQNLKLSELFLLSMLFRHRGTAEVKHVPIFIRKDLGPLYKNLKRFFESSNSVQFHLTGPPGIGKTAFVTLVCRMWVSKKTSRRILFISYRAQELSDVFIFEGAKVYGYKDGVESRLLASVVKTIVGDNDKFNLCVFDGVRNPDKDSDIKPVLQIVNGYTGLSGKFRRSITITSMSFRETDTDDISGHIFDSMDSWTWESHVDCFQAMFSHSEIPKLLQNDILTFDKKLEEVDDDGTETVDAAEEDDGLEDINDSDEEDVEGTLDEDKQVTPDQLLRYFEEKYFYAGGSARFMYSRAISDLKDELGRLFGAIKDWSPFTTNDIPSSNVHAINALMQQFKSNGRRMAAPVSKFVLVRAYEKCESLMLSAIRGIANSTENPSLQGWAFELEELDKIKKVLKSPLEHPCHLRSRERLVLYPMSEATFDGSTLTMPRNPVGLVVIWCLKWNQGCFDVALFWDGRLVTLQFTISPSHSLKLEYVSRLRSALLPHGLRPEEKVLHWFVVKDDVLDKFKHKTPTGAGRRTCKLEFTVSICKSTCFTVVEGAAENNLTNTAAVDIEVHSNKKRDHSEESSND